MFCESAGNREHAVDCHFLVVVVVDVNRAGYKIA